MMGRAFTLIELLIVMIVLGIVASIGAQITASIYERYIINRSVQKLEALSEQALDLIAKRLQYRLKDSVIARNGTTTIALNSATSGSYQTIEWIGIDQDGRLGAWRDNYNKPGWSGYIDIDNFTDPPFCIKTPGSFLSAASQTIWQVSHHKVSLDGSTSAKAAIYFKTKNSYLEGDINDQFGWNKASNAKQMFTLRRQGDDQFCLDTKPPLISERYILAYSAYALYKEGENLMLSYNFRPWQQEEYDDSTTPKALLLEGVQTLRFKSAGKAIRIKLCVHAKGLEGLDVNASICKERMVF